MLDRALSLSLSNYAVVKLIMDSPFTILIYKIATMLRTSEEKIVVNQLRSYK